MAYWCDDRSLDVERRRLDAAQAVAFARLEWRQLENSLAHSDPARDGDVTDRVLSAS